MQVNDPFLCIISSSTHSLLNFPDITSKFHITAMYVIVVLYIKLKLSVCVFMYVRLQLENRYTDLNHTWHAYSFRPERDFRKVKTLRGCPEFESR